MRIKSISIQNLLPIKRFFADEVGSTVMIAGPNGIGKTRILQGMINYFRNLRNNEQVSLQIEATSNAEVKLRIPVKVATHSGPKLPLTPSSQSLVDQYQSGNFKSIIFDQNDTVWYLTVAPTYPPFLRLLFKMPFFRRVFGYHLAGENAATARYQRGFLPPADRLVEYGRLAVFDHAKTYRKPISHSGCSS